MRNSRDTRRYTRRPSSTGGELLIPGLVLGGLLLLIGLFVGLRQAPPSPPRGHTAPAATETPPPPKIPAAFPTTLTTTTRQQLDLSLAGWIGEPEAPVQLVVFVDYACNKSVNFSVRVQKVVESFPSTRVAMALCPGPKYWHERALPAALAAEAARQQGKLWELHALLAKEEQLSDAKLLKHSSAAGLDSNTYQKTLGDERLPGRIRSLVLQAEAAGAKHTAALFLNGRLLGSEGRSAALDEAELRKHIEGALRRVP